MNNRMRVTSITGIPFGLLFGLYLAVKFNPAVGFVLGMAAGAIFGVSMSYILEHSGKIIMEHIPLSKSCHPFQVLHLRTVKLEFPYDRAFDACLAAIRQIPGCKVKVASRQTGEIHALKRPSWKSLGDSIEVNVRETGINATEIHVSSKPVLSTTIIDYGSNQENVELIASLLKQYQASVNQTLQ